MRIIVIILLVLAAHFSLTPFAPAKAGHAIFYWPFAADTQPLLGFVGGLPNQSGSVLSPALAGIAGLCFLAAILGLFGVIVPTQWWPALVVAGAIASALLYILYFGLFSVIPIVIDVILLWGVFVQNWSVTGMRGV